MKPMDHIFPIAAGRRAVVLTAITTIAGLYAHPTLAHGPTPQKIDEQIVVAVPPAAAWALVGNFANFAAWNPALSGSSADKGNAAESVRTLNFTKGGSVTEQLDEYLAGEMSLSYRSGRTTDPKVLPASSYSARLRVVPDGSGSRIEWRCRAYRADTNNDPAPGLDDAAVVQALRAYIQPALTAAKKKLEGG